MKIEDDIDSIAVAASRAVCLLQSYETSESFSDFFPFVLVLLVERIRDQK